MVKYKNKEIKMAGNILGEPGIYSQNGFTGVNQSTGATVVYRNPRRGQGRSGSGAGSSAFAAQDPRRLDIPGPARDTGNATPGAEPPKEQPAQVQNQQADAQNNVAPVTDMTDLRTIIKVPPGYLTGVFTSVFAQYGGVLFPYTPQITLEHKADYTSNTPLHSNYAINFYKSSSVSDITITANFTVQKQEDAEYYLGAIRILSALTKMRFGDDPLAGSPPPICRLFAYGEYVLKNVPVAITSVRHDLPEDVDFFVCYVRGEQVSVPTKASVTVNCKPIYSRREMAAATVDSYISNSFVGKGYL